ncbi:hypothetical protein AK828_02455 [Cutibacterium acnes]|jgi:hypothetical protein|nr:hypothetical protein AK827_09155 [Cutibacterium acnes]KPG67087.1 hypothetical protein AK828_02455 [Cutibacterium acnes]
MVEDFSVGFEKFVTGGAACGVIVVDVAATGEEPSVSDSFAEACCLSSSICRSTSAVLVGVSVGMAFFMRSGVQ